MRDHVRSRSIMNWRDAGRMGINVRIFIAQRRKDSQSAQSYCSQNPCFSPAKHSLDKTPQSADTVLNDETESKKRPFTEPAPTSPYFGLRTSDFGLRTSDFGLRTRSPLYLDYDKLRVNKPLAYSSSRFQRIISPLGKTLSAYSCGGFFIQPSTIRRQT